jgi:hypothetical protein
MPRRFSRPPNHDDLRSEERQVYSPDVSRVLALAFGVAALIGLVTGLVWVAWNLVRAHLLPQ